MDINLNAPALLFPAISLLLLAFTNRFLALAALIRTLYDRYQVTPDEFIIAQIGNLRYRVQLIKNMQALGVGSLFLCTGCMFVLFAGYQNVGKLLFAVSLLLMMGSLGVSLREIQVSVNALNLQLRDIETDARHG